MKRSFLKNKGEWEDLAKLDLFWVILTIPKKKFRNWKESEFFGEGQKEAGWIIYKTKEFGLPKSRGRSLDFGCGVGRVTRYLGKYFKESIGIDISEEMIKNAKELNKKYKNCKFILNKRDDLRIFPENYFDLVYSNLVLQHISNKKRIKKYIEEFFRITKKRGLIIFQIPTKMPPTSNLGRINLGCSK